LENAVERLVGIGVPVVRAGRTVAVLELLLPGPDPLDPETLATLRGLGELLAGLEERCRRQNLEHAREEHLRAMIEAGPSCIKLLAADGVLLEINDAGVRMVEAGDPGQLVGRPVVSLVAPEHQDAFREFHGKVIAGWAGSLELEVVGLRGTRRWVETHAAPVRGPGGEMCHLAVSVDVTERKRAEEVIRYIAAHARCLLWHAEVEATEGDGVRWKVRVSDEQAAQRFFPLEVSAGERYAQRWYEARPLEERRRTDAYAAAQVRTGQNYVQEYQATDGTGKTRWLREDVHVEPIGPGKWRAVGICTDVTAQRGAQAALRKREELLRQVLDNLPVGVWVVDADGQIVRANPAGERIWAGALGEGRPHSLDEPGELLFEPLGPDAHAVTRAITRGETSLNEEIAIICADGARKTLLNSAVPLQNPDGSIVGAIVVNEDITERKRAERRDRAFQALGAQLNAALSPQDAARTILAVANELVGWDACWLDICDLETMVVQPVVLIDAFDGETREVASPTRVLTENSLAARAMKEGPLLINRPRGIDPRISEPGIIRFGNLDRPSESVLVVPIRLGSRCIGALSIQSYTPNAYDASDLDTLQALADYCTGALERARSEEHRRLLEQQLQQAQKLEAIGRLAGGVAHDFNNMLAVIAGYSELLLMRGVQDSSDRIAIEEIRAASNRAAGLTSQLLAFSRKSIVQPEVLRINDVVENMERMLERLIGEDIRLTCRLDPRAGCVRVDRSQLDQVLLNLAVNARDAMPMGGALRVTTHSVRVDAVDGIPDLQPGDYVLLTVSDTGSGMTDETISRIWEPFFTTKPTGKGTGLGLATVYGIVKQHEGSVSVRSRPGEGSVFQVYLPQVTPAEIAAQLPAVSGSEPGGPETILVVEDEEMLRRLITLVLTQSGYHVLAAADGDQALKVAESVDGPIHLLLADVVIPGGVSGRMVAQQLAARRPDTRVLMMSGYTDDAVLRHGVESGAAPFIQKPFAPADLVSKVQEVLRGSNDAGPPGDD
jgi:PAS domain S-box-containing protein